MQLSFLHPEKTKKISTSFLLSPANFQVLPHPLPLHLHRVKYQRFCECWRSMFVLPKLSWFHMCHVDYDWILISSVCSVVALNNGQARDKYIIWKPLKSIYLPITWDFAHIFAKEKLIDIIHESVKQVIPERMDKKERSMRVKWK